MFPKSVLRSVEDVIINIMSRWCVILLVIVCSSILQLMDASDIGRSPCPHGRPSSSVPVILSSLSVPFRVQSGGTSIVVAVVLLQCQCHVCCSLFRLHCCQQLVIIGWDQPIALFRRLGQLSTALFVLMAAVLTVHTRGIKSQPDHVRVLVVGE